MDEEESHIFKYTTIGTLLGIVLGFYTFMGLPWGLALGIVSGATIGIKKDFDRNIKE